MTLKNIAKEAFPNTLTPESMKHVVILHADIHDVEKLLKPWSSRLKRSELIQSSPKLGTSFIYAHTKDRVEPSKKREISVLNTLRDTIKPDLCVILKNETKEDINNSLARIKFVNKYLPDTQAILVSDNPEETIKHLEEMGKIDQVGADNIVSWKDSKNAIISIIDAKTNPSISDDDIYTQTINLKAQYDDLPSVIEARNLSDTLVVEPKLSNNNGMIADNLLIEATASTMAVHYDDL